MTPSLNGFTGACAALTSPARRPTLYRPCFSSEWFDCIEPPRTFLNNFSAEKTKCAGVRSGWFDCTEPSLWTYSQGEQGVYGTFTLVRCGSTASNLLPIRTLCYFSTIFGCFWFFAHFSSLEEVFLTASRFFTFSSLLQVVSANSHYCFTLFSFACTRFCVCTHFSYCFMFFGTFSFLSHAHSHLLHCSTIFSG